MRKLVLEHGIAIIHQPMPVSPREPSSMYDLGAAVIIGPMNGGMDYPKPFRHMESRRQRAALVLARWLSGPMNWLLPGKRKAALLLVANERTRRALPKGVCPRIEQLVENGVDLTLWRPHTQIASSQPAVTRYVFVGRLVDWKAVDLLLIAFHRASKTCPMTLTVIGDGVERERLEKLARNLQVLEEEGADTPGKARFLGWMAQADCAERMQESDALVLPSLLECGGAVVLEAMAMEKPVIATAWGGPLDYLDSSCAILVEPSSKEGFIEGLVGALADLAMHPDRRAQMGRRGRAK